MKKITTLLMAVLFAVAMSGAAFAADKPAKAEKAGVKAEEQKTEPAAGEKVEAKETKKKAKKKVKKHKKAKKAEAATPAAEEKK